MTVPISKLSLLYFFYVNFSNLHLFIASKTEISFSTYTFLLYALFLVQNISLLLILPDVHFNNMIQLVDKKNTKIAFFNFTFSLVILGILSFYWINFIDFFSLSAIRTHLQHSLTLIFWILVFGTFFVLGTTRKLPVILLAFFFLFLVSSRLFFALGLLIFFFRIRTFRFKIAAWILFIFVIGSLALMPIIRDIPFLTLSSLSIFEIYEPLLYFVKEYFFRNVALLQGNDIPISCLPHYSPSPFLTLIPRSVWSSKPLLDNVSLFMCYFSVSDIPSKSSGFFMAAWRELDLFNSVIIIITHFILVTIFLCCVRKRILTIAPPLSLLIIFNPHGLVDGPFSGGVQAQILFIFLVFAFSAIKEMRVDLGRRVIRGERWSRKLRPVVKVDRIMKETIQNEETKEPSARV